MLGYKNGGRWPENLTFLLVAAAPASSTWLRRELPRHLLIPSKLSTTSLDTNTFPWARCRPFLPLLSTLPPTEGVVTSR